MNFNWISYYARSDLGCRWNSNVEMFGVDKHVRTEMMTTATTATTTTATFTSILHYYKADQYFFLFARSPSVISISSTSFRWWYLFLEIFLLLSFILFVFFSHGTCKRSRHRTSRINQPKRSTTWKVEWFELIMGRSKRMSVRATTTAVRKKKKEERGKKILRNFVIESKT